MLRPGQQTAIVAFLLFLLACGAAVPAGARTSQPILFSHKIHVSSCKIECRFCHAEATKSASAGIPSVEKCMVCHRVIAVDRPEIRKIAQYWKEKKPIPWNRVTELPDHTYFPHKRMVNAGVPCLTCHPGIDKADVADQQREFTMGWCMDCHRKRGVSIDCWTCHV